MEKVNSRICATKKYFQIRKLNNVFKICFNNGLLTTRFEKPRQFFQMIKTWWHNRKIVGRPGKSHHIYRQRR